MQLNEFDKALRERYENGSLPPDLGPWEQLARRLDDYEAAAVPARKPRRGVIAFWPYWAAAASILFIGWLFLQESETLPVAQRQETTRPAGGSQAAPLPEPSTPAPVLKEPSSAPQSPATRQLAAADKPVHPYHHKTPTATVPPPQATASSRQPDEHVTPAPTANQDPQRALEAPPQRQPVNLALAAPQTGAADDGFESGERERRPLGVDLNGGYGPGSLKRNYALGVSVHRKLSERLQVEAGVAVVSGTYEAFNTASAAAFRPGVEAAPENTSTRLTYLQAAPALTYELFPGVFAGAGVDAQRLLSDAREAAGYEYTSDQLEAQPSWDFGYTVRAGYRVTRNIKAGLQYRNSMHTTAPVSGTSVQPRNYLLFQLGYTIR